jgi:HAD superfamily hydrolase (TIGR01509 family)
MFDDYLEHVGQSSGPFTQADYFEFVDGRPRFEGVSAFLASRGLSLPFGNESDGPDADTVCGLGNRKNTFFEQVLANEGVEAFRGSVALVEALKARGTAMAVVSSSRNATKVLRAAGIIGFFPIIVDGIVAADEGLAGKPQPDTYLDAARKLGVSKERAVVFEDAVSGVRSGHAGGFGLVVGVDRGVGVEVLRANGADVVVQDLQELLP